MNALTATPVQRTHPIRPTPLPPLHNGPPTPPPLTTAPQIWLVDPDEHREPAARHASAILVAEELARADEFQLPVDRDAFVCAHVALRFLLSGYLGIPPRKVPLARAACLHCEGPHGRPVVTGVDLHFSLSHSARLSLLAFATEPVGIDVEAIPPPRTVAEVRDVLHPREAAELATLPRDLRPAAFTRVWTRKEAYLKGLGIGISGDPSADYVGTAATVPPLEGWTVTDVAVAGNHRAAVAVRSAGPSGRGRVAVLKEG